MNGVRAPKDALVFYEKTEAAKFEEAYPLGNGSLGAMFYGGVHHEKLSLNHDTLWSGYPRGDQFRGNKKASLDKVKQLVREKKYVEADAEASKNFGCYGSACYMPMGNLLIDYTYSGKKSAAYERTLDISTAVAKASYRVEGTAYQRSAYVSHPHNALIYRNECENGTFDASITLTSDLYSKTYVVHETKMLLLEGECPVSTSQCIERTDRTTIYSDLPEERGIRFLCGVSVLTDGVVKNGGIRLNVKGASYIELRLAAETSFNGFDKHPFLEGKEYKNACINRLLALCSVEEADIRTAHIKDYKKYFNRMALSLGTSNKGRTPTSLRLEQFQQGSEDKALPALLFHFGRYLTIAGSRKGTQATNLQGIWNEHFFAPWSSNYTVNINTEMNYFPTLAIGLPEMYEPMLKLIEEVSQTGQLTARELYDADGWVCHHNTDLWRHTQPVAGFAVFLFWNACGAWLCHHLAEYYDYTLDRKFLEKTAFPIMCEAARFYLTQLADSEDGYRIIFPSTSPENRYKVGDSNSSVSETTEMTMATVRELFGNICRFAKLLDISNELTQTVAAELPRLRPSVIGSDGRLTEWYGDKEDVEPQHRHVSHLYGLHPGHEISPLTTPELVEACRKTLAVRGDDGTGWSLAWKCNFYARLFMGDRALNLIHYQLRPTPKTETAFGKGGGSYPNLLCAHPPFQIDGNYGITAGMCEMLVQSTPDSVHILPALPGSWTDVSVRGLRAMGNRKVDIQVKDGKLVACEITGPAPETVYINSQDVTASFQYQNGKMILVK